MDDLVGNINPDTIKMTAFAKLCLIKVQRKWKARQNERKRLADTKLK